MNFINIGEWGSKIKDEFKEKHSNIEWRKIKGLRHIIAHNYLGIDKNKNWSIIKKTLPEFKKELKNII